MEPRADGVSKPRSLALEKMESLVRQMQSTDSGVPVRCQKLFLTTIPSAFMGYDLIEWLMENLPIDDSAEALHLASLLCQHGYFFPVGDAKTLQVKDDSSLYRFQTPYYWPSRNHVPDSTDYAIYLHKKIAKNKQKHGLEDCELEGYNQLKKTLASKWDFVTMQADEQLKMAKDRKKGDKIVSESQERAYWRVYRPPPGFTNTLEMPPVPDRSRQSPGSCGSSAIVLSKELGFMRLSLSRLRIKISQVAESTLTHHETYLELDPFLSPVQPSNPWHTDDPTFMELNEPLVEFPTERRVRRWAISMEETVSDPTGLHEFTACMRKEFSHENIRFWSAVHQLRKMPLSQVPDEVRSIYDEFLRPGAPCEINIDGKTMERTQELLKNPTRFTYDCAADHIFDLLLKKDCYPRFLRSEHYKNLLTNATNPTSKKRFFTFGAPGKKKISSVTPPNISQLVASSGRLSSEDQSAVATSAGGGGAKPDCDPPYRMEEDAGIFLGGPVTPPPSARAPPALSPSPSPFPARPSSDVTGPTSSALVPVSTSASAVVPYTPAKQPSGPTSTSVPAPVTTTHPSSTLPASATASSSASTTASTSSSTTASVAPPSTTSSILSSTSTPAATLSAGESSGLSTASKNNNQGSVSAPAPGSSASGSVASAGKATPAGSAGAVTRAAGPAGTVGESAGQSATRTTSASPAATAAAAVASTSAVSPIIGATAAAGSTIPPAEPPLSVGLASSEVARAPEGGPAKDAELLRSGDAALSQSAAATGGGDGTVQMGLRRSAEPSDSLSASCRDKGVAGSSAAPLCPPPLVTGDVAGDSPTVWTAAIAPPAMFQDSAAPLATIDERDESTPPPPPPLPPPLSPPGTAGSPPSASALASQSAATAAVVAGAAETAGAVAGSGSASAAPPSATPHTEIVKLTDRCAQTVETGDSVDYGSTTDKQCEANLPRERGTRRKEKRVKICEAPASAAVTGVSTAGGEAASTDDAAKRRSRSASADTKRERKESRARREPRKKSSSERRRARLEDGELEGASPKRGDVVAPAAGEPAPQKLDESSVCPWENDLPTPTWL